MSKNAEAAARSSKKRLRNASDYRSSKAAQDHVLLRLDKGDRARLDAACLAAGLSRAAFAKLYLMPLADGLAARLPQIERARSIQSVSLATFLSRAVDLALRDPENRHPPPAISSEFDALFGPADGGA